MFPAGGGTNLPSSAQLQEAALALSTTAGKYTAVSEELIAVASTAIAAGQELTTRWHGQAPASFLTSLDKLAGDVSNIADALAVSANAMLSLAQAIDAQGGAIVTANQLTAQEPAHPSSAQAQQLSNALTAANTAMGEITSAANAAAGQLDQVKGIGTCSTGKGDAVITAIARLLTAALIIKAISNSMKGGGGKEPPGGPPAPPSGEEPPEGWRDKLLKELKANWKSALRDALIGGVFTQLYNADKNYTVAHNESLSKMIWPNSWEIFYHISIANFGLPAIEKNGIPSLIGGGVGGGVGLVNPILGAIFGPLSGSSASTILNPPAPPPIIAIILPDGMLHVTYYENGSLKQANMSAQDLDNLAVRLKRTVSYEYPPKSTPKPAPTPSPTHVVPHPPLG